MSVATLASHSSAPLSATRLQSLKRLCRVQADASASCSQRLTVSSGLPTLDQLLPHGGLRLGSLVEWLEPPAETGVEAAAGAAAFALAVGVRLQANADLPPGRALVVIDRGGRLYPPAVVPWLEAASAPSSASPSALSPLPSPARSAKVTQRGDRQASQHASQPGHYRQVTPRLFVIRPASDADEIWAIDQALRCPGVAAVVGWPQRVAATPLRRWQLAAKASGVVGLFVRPAVTRQQPTWSEVRVQVQPAVQADHANASPSRPWIKSAAAGCDDQSLRNPSASSGVASVDQCHEGFSRAVNLASWIDVRAYRLVRVGGGWEAAMAVAEPAVDCLLDLTSGRECLRSAVVSLQPDWSRGTNWKELACRAS